jgi:hypothetical protein
MNFVGEDIKHNTYQIGERLLIRNHNGRKTIDLCVSDKGFEISIFQSIPENNVGKQFSQATFDSYLRAMRVFKLVCEARFPNKRLKAESLSSDFQEFK